MMLSALLEGITVTKLFHAVFGSMVVTQDVMVNHIQYDSTKVKNDDLFVAIRGVSADGHRFINSAVTNGAAVVVMEDDAAVPDSFFMHTGVVKIVVPNSRRTLAQLAANFYGHPAQKLTCIGVTGTNGKTTTTHLIQQILGHSPDSSGLQGKVGLIGTIDYVFGTERIPATHTTPESLELQKYFSKMVVNGCTHVVMEISSHALQQERVFGIDFAAGVFTNLTQDHLDYHGTMENYFSAKKILFDGLTSSGWALVNADDAWSEKIVAGTHAKVLRYGTTGRADVKATNIMLSVQGTRFMIENDGEKIDIASPLVGRFNVSNILAAFSAGIAMGIPKARIREGIAAVSSVPGRFERVNSMMGWTAIIDYAHTPDALEKCLSTIHDILPQQRLNPPAGRAGKIITVFGAGGDRDKTKRPKMGAITESLSDVVIITSDNPRTEDPRRIIHDVRAGIKSREKVYEEVDRRAAIIQALTMAQPDDIVLIAGKGHEDYQVIGKDKVHFSDKEIVQEFIRDHT
ncbi:MAG: UDP-N-acetylmuramoyl-L-alanyl-D-glutamate--2,6-diaminopimelate ligase [Bacteroidota bacterium]|nr:UDP-N-acetylmuramoyl-L-alanyl-D-glutamate--2,6-diaminopimelate ligase [Bacteroidota bacterium]